MHDAKNMKFKKTYFMWYNNCVTSQVYKKDQFEVTQSR